MVIQKSSLVVYSWVMQFIMSYATFGEITQETAERRRRIYPVKLRNSIGNGAYKMNSTESLRMMRTSLLVLMTLFLRKAMAFSPTPRFQHSALLKSCTVRHVMSPSHHSPDDSFFDLIVGNDFVDEASAVEEVGGDPWFLEDHEEDDD